MKTLPPLVTIGITCFNAERLVSRAIYSALSTTWPNYELIVVDDASSDGSVQVVKALIAAFPQARLVERKNNGGTAAARNTILEHAKGEFIAFYDDDDVSFPDRLDLQFQAIENAETLYKTDRIFCYATGSRIYQNGYKLNLPGIGSQAKVPHGTGVVDYLLFNARMRGWFYGAGVPTCALMARTQLIRTLGGFDDNLRRVEDVDLAIRHALKGGYFVGTTTNSFLQYATIGTDKSPEANFSAEKKLISKYSGYLISRNRHEYALRWFRIRYLHFSRQRSHFVLALALFLLRYPFSGFLHAYRSLPSRLVHEHRMKRRTRS